MENFPKIERRPSTLERVQTVHYPGQCTEKKRKKKRKKKKKKKTRESAFVSSLTRNTASVSRLLRGVGRSKGGRIGVAGWLAGLLLRAAFCGLRIPSRTTRGKTPLQHRDKSRGEARGDGGRDGRARGERRRERERSRSKEGKEKKKSGEEKEFPGVPRSS